MSIYPTPGTMPCSVIFPADPAVKHRTYCVLGVPRGGTSMVAGLLQGLGIPMGDSLNDAVEDTDFLGHRGNRELFTHAGHAGEKATYLESVLQAIRRRDISHEAWGWKDPLAALYLPDILSYLRSPHFILVTRDLGAVAQAEMIVEPGWPDDHVLAHMHGAARLVIAMAEFLSAAKAPALLMSYERTLRHSEVAAEALLDFTGIQDAAFVGWAKRHILERRGTS